MVSSRRIQSFTLHMSEIISNVVALRIKKSRHQRNLNLLNPSPSRLQMLKRLLIQFPPILDTTVQTADVYKIE